MQLDILQRHDSETSKAILAAAALNQSETPYFSPNSEKFAEQAQQLLQELKAALGVEGDSPDEQARVREAISELVVQSVMAGSTLGDVRSRLGIKGELPLSSYKITFAKGLLKQSGENENFIRRALKANPEIQHILPKNLPIELGVKGMTLILIPQFSRGDHDHWLILDAMRAGEKLVISDIYRIFPEVVDLSLAAAPLDILKSFVEVYGLAFKIDQLGPQKFFENLVLPTSEDKLSYELPNSDGGVSLSTTGSTLRKKGPDGEMEVVGTHIIASYCIDYHKYKKDKIKFLKR